MPKNVRLLYSPVQKIYEIFIIEDIYAIYERKKQYGMV